MSSDLMKPENRGKIALGAGGVAGGIGVLAVNSFIAHLFWPVGPLVIGALILWGSWRLFQKPNSALVGMVGLAAGVLVAATALPLVGGLASLLLTLSGIGLIAGGVWSLVQVFRNRR
jgi:hypothetical protein